MLDALAALSKALLYVGVLTCAGAAFAGATLRLPSDVDSVATRVLRRGAVLTIGAAVACAIVLIFRLGGGFDEPTLSAVFVSSSGAAMGLQIAGASLLLASSGDPLTSHAMRLTNAALVTLSFVFSGHAGALSARDGLVGFLHVSAAAWWVGSLWCLSAASVRSNPPTVAALVHRFGVLATGLVGGLVVAGLVLVLLLTKLEDLPNLSGYEQFLAVKICVVAIVLGIAAYNRFRLTPRVRSGDSGAVPALRRMITVELAAIAVVLIVTALMTTYTSPHE
jgi:copper resistance protein D